MKKFLALILIVFTSFCFVGCEKQTNKTREEVYSYISSNIQKESVIKFTNTDNFVSGSSDFEVELLNSNSKYSKIYYIYQPLVFNSLQFVSSYYKQLSNLPAITENNSKKINQSDLNNLYDSAEKFFTNVSSFNSEIKTFEKEVKNFSLESTTYIEDYKYTKFEKYFIEFINNTINFTDNFAKIYFNNYVGKLNFKEVVLDEEFESKFNIFYSYSRFLESKIIFEESVKYFDTYTNNYNELNKLYIPSVKDNSYEEYNYLRSENYLDFVTVKNKTMTYYVSNLLNNWTLVVSDIENSFNNYSYALNSRYTNKKLTEDIVKSYDTIIDNCNNNIYIRLFTIVDEIEYWITFTPDPIY